MRGLGPDGRRLLREGDRFDPPASARARVGTALAARLGTAALVGALAATETTAAAGATSVGWVALGMKALGAVVLGGLVIGGGLRLAPGSAPRPQSSTASAAAAAPSAPKRPVPTSPPRDPTAESSPRSTAVVVRDAVPTAALPPPARRDRAPAVAPTAAPDGRSPAPAGETTTLGLPPALITVPQIGAEATLLREVQLARTSGDAIRARALLGRYGAEHPRGALRDVATVEEVLTLCALGRIDDARALARPLLGAGVTSSLTARLRSSCAGEEP